MDAAGLDRAIRAIEWGSLIRFARESRDIDQFWLGQEMGCQQSVLSRWERPGNVPTIRTLCRVAAHTGVALAVTMRPLHGSPLEVVFDGIEMRRRMVLLQRATMLSAQADGIYRNLGLRGAPGERG